MYSFLIFTSISGNRFTLLLLLIVIHCFFACMHSVSGNRNVWASNQIAPWLATISAHLLLGAHVVLCVSARNSSWQCTSNHHYVHSFCLDWCTQSRRTWTISAKKHDTHWYYTWYSCTFCRIAPRCLLQTGLRYPGIVERSILYDRAGLTDFTIVNRFLWNAVIRLRFTRNFKLNIRKHM